MPPGREDLHGRSSLIVADHAEALVPQVGHELEEHLGLGVHVELAGGRVDIGVAQAHEVGRIAVKVVLQEAQHVPPQEARCGNAVHEEHRGPGPVPRLQVGDVAE